MIESQRAYVSGSGTPGYYGQGEPDFTGAMNTGLR